jgi:hypothetical protein
MPYRQLMVFRIGCIAAVLTAAVHLVGHLLGPQPPANDIERELVTLATTYEFQLPGGASRSLMDFMDGFSLMFSVLLAALGGVGYLVEKRAAGDALLMAGVARVLAGASAVALVITLTHFFIVPALLMALVAVCFAIASVKAPA